MSTQELFCVQNESEDVVEMDELELELDDVIEKSEVLFLVKYKDKDGKNFKKCT